jgi:hypothetical protein
LASRENSKLGRTLKELESALSDWDSLSLKGGKGKQAKRPAKAAAETQNDKEFRKKTKKLLLQLRQQLADLED